MSKDDLRCKLCDHIVFQQYALKGAGEVKNHWYHCHCGYMFHNSEFDPKKTFTKEYQEEYKDKKLIDERMNYYIRMYAQIIEEKTYGRRFLDVGFCYDYIIREMKRRGWLSTGIDIIENQYIQGFFEDYDFEDERFDCIWMGDVLQSMNDPNEAIKKVWKLLNPDGLLFIVTPNTDNMRKDIIPMWGHWDMERNKHFFSELLVRKMIWKADPGFMSSPIFLYFDAYNTSQRFPSWNNMHILIQKKSIEDFTPEIKEDFREDFEDFVKQEEGKDENTKSD